MSPLFWVVVLLTKLLSPTVPEKDTLVKDGNIIADALNDAAVSAGSMTGVATSAGSITGVAAAAAAATAAAANAATTGITGGVLLPVRNSTARLMLQEEDQAPVEEARN